MPKRDLSINIYILRFRKVKFLCYIGITDEIISGRQTGIKVRCFATLP